MKMQINGQWVEASNGRYREVYNPGTGEAIDRVPEATVEDADTALRAVQEGKERMRKLPAHERSAILFRTAQAIESQSKELSELLPERTVNRFDKRGRSWQLP
jgi:acyl-CoA reductase-like NAD-dependent aldehyde dehydrogenase